MKGQHSKRTSVQSKEWKLFYFVAWKCNPVDFESGELHIFSSARNWLARIIAIFRRNHLFFQKSLDKHIAIHVETKKSQI